jgi:hypothetical protein
VREAAGSRLRRRATVAPGEDRGTIHLSLMRTLKRSQKASRPTRKGARSKRHLPSDCAKQCSCGASFTRKDLIQLRSLTPVGMLHLSGDPVAKTMYCFTHTRWSCRTTFALPVETFRDEIGEEIPRKCLAGTASCRDHCSKIEDLQLCDSECTLAPYRRFLLERLVRRR